MRLGRFSATLLCLSCVASGCQYLVSVKEDGGRVDTAADADTDAGDSAVDAADDSVIDASPDRLSTDVQSDAPGDRDGTDGNPDQSPSCRAGDSCVTGDPCMPAGQCNASGVCVGVAKAPSTPRAIAPTNGEYTGSLHQAKGDTLRPLFRWAAGADDGCSPPTYEIQIENSCSATAFGSCDFSSITVSQSGIATTSWRPATNLIVGMSSPIGLRYFWRLRACRGSVCSAFTPVRYLEVGRPIHDIESRGYSSIALSTPSTATWLYTERSLAIDSTPEDILESAYALASGDTDGDGYADLIVAGDAGLKIHRGSLLFVPDVVSFSAVDTHAFRSAASGDVNGDGMADVAIGSTWYDSSTPGQVRVLNGAAWGSMKVDVTISPPHGSTGYPSFGEAIVIADFDSDGFADMAVGAPSDGPSSSGSSHPGVVYVFYGSAAGIKPAAYTEIDHPVPTTSAAFGAALAAGDLDGDGYPDLAVGSARQGSIFVFKGGAQRLPANPKVTLTNPLGAGLEFGGNVVIADTNGDGANELIVSSSSAPSGTLTGAGAVVLYPGTATGINSSNPVTISPPKPATDLAFGKTLGAAGDVNGDGLADLLITTHSTAPGAWLFYGSATGFVSSAPKAITTTAQGSPAYGAL